MAMRKQARITSKGQVTVPHEIRRLLGVRKGDALVFESDRRGVRVRPARSRSPFAKFRGIGNPGVPSGRKGLGRWIRRLRDAGFKKTYGEHLSGPGPKLGRELSSPPK